MWRGFSWMNDLTPQYRFLALTILVVLLGLTAGFSVLLYRQAETAAQSDAQLVSEEVAHSIEDQLRASTEVLRAAAGLVDASESVSRADWKTFVDRLELAQALPGIQGVGFAAFVPSAQRLAFRDKIRAEGFPTFEIWPPSENRDLSAIQYLEPFNARNQRAFGYDMFSEPTRTAAMNQARDTNLPVLSGKVKLVQETSVDVQAGTLLYLPVYRRGSPVDTIEQRRAALVGWVYSPYRMTDLMNGTLSSWRGGEYESLYSLRIYDGKSVSQADLLYDSHVVPGDLSSSYVRTTPIEVVGRVWTLQLSRLQLISGDTGGNLVATAGIGGLLLSLLAFALSLSMLGTHTRARKQAERLTAELSASETFYRGLFDMLNGFNYSRMIYGADGKPIDWEYLIVNKGFGTLTGRSDVVGKKASEVFNNISSTDPELLDFYGTVARTGVPQRRDLFIQATGRWCTMAAYSPKPDHFVVVIDSIDEYKAAQLQIETLAGRLNEVLNNSSSASYKRDLETNHYEYLSPVFTRLTGYDVEEFLRQPLDVVVGLVHPDDRDPVSAAVSDAVNSPDGTPCQIDYRLRSVEDNYIWLRDQFTVVHDAAGHRALIGSIQDVTLMKYADTQRVTLETRNRQLEKAESLGRMASSVAHLFNNHLQAVVSHLELADTRGGRERHEHLHLSRVSLEKAIEVSQLLLTYLGQTPGDREVCSWSQLCREAFQEWSTRNRLPAQAWQLALSEPGPLVLANPRLIRFALGHVLSNAREAQGTAVGTLSLATSLVPAETVGASHRFPVGWKPKQPSYAVVTITDGGSGIAEADLDKALDPFYSTKGVGRGLGLPAVQGIVQAHEGVVTLSSRPGSGTKVSLYLPVVQGTLAPPVELAAEGKASAVDSVGQEDLAVRNTVLFVDDDEALREVTGEMISLLGYHVVTAASGPEAVELLKAHGESVVCVVTDLSMPDVDGWQTMALLKALRPQLPVVLASGFDRSRALSGHHTEVPDGFLSKPFNLALLREALAKATSR